MNLTVLGVLGLVALAVVYLSAEGQVPRGVAVGVAWAVLIAGVVHGGALLLASARERTRARATEARKAREERRAAR